MLLAADVGNTNVVFALFEGRAIKARWRIATDARRTGDEYAVWLLQLLEIEGYGREEFERALAAAFEVERREELGSGTRTLYLARPR